MAGSCRHGCKLAGHSTGSGYREGRGQHVLKKGWESWPARVSRRKSEAGAEGMESPHQVDRQGGRLPAGKPREKDGWKK